jgi:hypothetical protein
MGMQGKGTFEVLADMHEVKRSWAHGLFIRGWSLRVARRKCRAAGCGGCPHGPYLFARRWDKSAKRTVEVYVGR